MEAEVVSSTSTLLRDGILVSLLINFIVSCWLHYKERLSIYCDYTDVAFTVVGTIGVVIIGFILGFIGVSQDVIRYICIGLFSLIALIVVMKSIRVNGFFFGLMAAIAKYSVMAFYIFTLFKIFNSGGTPRKKGESKRSYQARQRRETKNQVWWAALLTMAVGYLIHITVRNDYFVSIDEYLGRTENEDSRLTEQQ